MTKPHNVTEFPGAHPGTLTTSSGERLPVRAYERPDNTLMLVLMPDGGEPADAPVQRALLEYTCPQGLVRVHGEAHFEDRNVVRFQPTAPDREIVQRRAHVRAVSAHAVMLALESQDGPLHAHTVDLSGGGMLVRGVEGLALGQHVHFSLELSPDEPPVLGAGRVVRGQGSDLRALVFEEMSESERERLIRHVFRCLHQTPAGAGVDGAHAEPARREGRRGGPRIQD